MAWVREPSAARATGSWSRSLPSSRPAAFGVNVELAIMGTPTDTGIQSAVRNSGAPGPPLRVSCVKEVHSECHLWVTYWRVDASRLWHVRPGWRWRERSAVPLRNSDQRRARRSLVGLVRGLSTTATSNRTSRFWLEKHVSRRHCTVRSSASGTLASLCSASAVSIPTSCDESARGHPIPDERHATTSNGLMSHVPHAHPSRRAALSSRAKTAPLYVAVAVPFWQVDVA